MLQKIKYAYIIMILCGLSACSIFLPKEQQQIKLAKLNNWQINGKISITHPKDSITGYLTWQQNQQEFDLYIAGPFAQGATQIKGNQQQVSLLLPSWKKPQTSDSPKKLMQQHLGWSFPVDNLRYWIKGMVDPNTLAADIEYSDNGLLKRVKQAPWTIELSRYQLKNGYWLPGRIKIKGVQYRFILAIKNWDLYD